MAVIDNLLQWILSARYGKDVRQAIHDSIDAINQECEGNVTAVTAQTLSAEAWAKGTKDGTAVESTDPQYHNNAKYFSEQASGSATDAHNDAVAASGSATAAAGSVTAADGKVKDAEAWANGQRSGTDVPSTDPAYHNNAYYWQTQANYWYQQAQAIAQGLAGALLPMGTVTFANLPALANADAGWMYNVSDEFTTTSDFKEGSGHVVPAGSNVYKTGDDKWDVLAGSPVSGVKGDNELSYRNGNVNITKANIGLGNVPNTDFTTPVSTINADVPWYGTSSTAAATAAKVATTTDAKFTLVTGGKVQIKFDNENTATEPTLNVDGTGAKPIKAYGTTTPTVWWQAGDVVEFRYDGTNYIMGATAGQISKINSDLVQKTADVEVVADGVKTNSAMLDALYAAANLTKINPRSVLLIDNEIYRPSYISNERVIFGKTSAAGSNYISDEVIRLIASASELRSVSISIINGSVNGFNKDTTVPTSGVKFGIIY